MGRGSGRGLRRLKRNMELGESIFFHALMLRYLNCEIWRRLGFGVEIMFPFLGLSRCVGRKPQVDSEGQVKSEVPDDKG